MKRRVVAGLALIVLLMSGCRPSGKSGESGPPPDLPPPFADKVGEVPQLEAKLAEDPAMANLWDPSRRGDLDIFLTATSQLIAGGSRQGGEMPARLTVPLQKAKLVEAVATIGWIVSRTGKMPASLQPKIESHIAAVHGEPHLGVWRPKEQGKVDYDWSALAAWIKKDDPAYIREMLAAKKAAIGWSEVEHPTRPRLAREQSALEWLASVTTLSKEESARLEELRAAKPAAK